MGGLFEDPVEKKVYEVEYKRMKADGYAFHPFATYKDIIAAFALLLLLLGLTFAYGTHLDAPADPTSQYLPRPEWYFMWLFQMLKYFPGWTAIFAVAIIPGVIGGALMLLPFYDMNPYRHWSKRPVAVASMAFLMLIVGGLTAKAYWDDAHDPHALALAAASEGQGGTSGGHEGTTPAAGGAGKDGETVFKTTCTMCHGSAGTQIPNVNLFSKDFLSKRDVVQVVTNGLRGMPPFKGQLSEDEIKNVAKYLADNAK